MKPHRLRPTAAAGALALALAAQGAQGAPPPDAAPPPLLYSCCDSAVRPDGSCIAQATLCPRSSGFAVGLENLPASAGVDTAAPAAAFGDAFPSGVDGYESLTLSPPAPWLGYCLVADAASTTPAACLSVSLSPGVGAEIATVQIPMDPRWTAYEVCYGAPVYDDAGSPPCVQAATLGDPTVADVGGSCCGPAQALRLERSPSEWETQMAQELPGIPPPVVVLGPDGGPEPSCAHPLYGDSGPIVAYCDPSVGWEQAGLPDACEPGFDEGDACGAPPLDSGFAPLPPSPEASAPPPAPPAVAVFAPVQGGGCSVASSPSEVGEGVSDEVAWLAGLAALPAVRRKRGA